MKIYMQANQIVLPSWLNNKTVFQQDVPFVIEGTAAPSATITLEISKDPTDGRRVSKLDTEYGVILSLETTTSPKGQFRFNIPAYKATTDAYTFVFKCFSTVVTLSDIRCGDVWVFLGSEFLSIPMKNATAPAAPLKRQVMNHLRFLTPSRSGLEDDETDIAFEPKSRYKNAAWIKVTDTKELAQVSSSAFAFAYSIADQVHYPVGVVDLSVEDSTIINWLSDEALEHQPALYDYLMELGLINDEERYKKIIRRDKEKRDSVRLSEEIKEARSFFDFDLTKDEKLRELKGEESSMQAIEAVSDIDFPSSKSSNFNGIAKDSEQTGTGSAKNLDFTMFADLKPKKEKTIDDSQYTRLKYRTGIYFKSKLHPLRGLPIRGMCFSPDKDEQLFARYDLMLMGLLDTLSQIFEPKEVYDDALMPSMLFVALHPSSVDYEFPYKVIEFNEDLTAFSGRLNMPTGIVSLHDMLLPDKTKSFILGQRLAVIALGIHITPKMPRSCPECIGVERAGNKLILEFANLGDGLRLKEGETELRGFAVCGGDRVFYPANARILHGVRVMVWRDDILEPVSITYGFSPFPHEATFKNLNDLPVLPFRFDRDPAFYAPDLFFTSCDQLETVGIKERGGDFEKLDIYRTFKGNGVITVDTLHKTEGNASLHIKYETENSLYGFEPNLDYASLMAPIILRGRNKIIVDVFNPDTQKKILKIDGFGTTEINNTLTWQTLILPYRGDGDITLEHLRFTIEDSMRNGEIYIDNIRFE